MLDKKKLHVGCGSKILDGFINIDLLDVDGIDLKCDISKLPYENNSIDLIYSCANIEHFGRKEWKGVLKHWYDLLKPGAVLRLSTADFEAACIEYLENKNIENLLGLIVGGQKDKYDWHGMIFDYELLETTLLEIGFNEVKKYNWRETEHGHIDDFSQAYLPHMDKEKGRLMMLNIEAIK